uniref:Uncharacterized protein n=1 Tax=Meloidogyne hapla TaxID=6305 RepID=A0A1I8BJR8_MELHA
MSKSTKLDHYLSPSPPRLVQSTSQHSSSPCLIESIPPTSSKAPTPSPHKPPTLTPQLLIDDQENDEILSLNQQQQQSIPLNNQQQQQVRHNHSNNYEIVTDNNDLLPSTSSTSDNHTHCSSSVSGGAIDQSPSQPSTSNGLVTSSFSSSCENNKIIKDLLPSTSEMSSSEISLPIIPTSLFHSSTHCSSLGSGCAIDQSTSQPSTSNVLVDCQTQQEISIDHQNPASSSSITPLKHFNVEAVVVEEKIEKVLSKVCEEKKKASIIALNDEMDIEMEDGEYVSDVEMVATDESNMEENLINEKEENNLEENGADERGLIDEMEEGELEESDIEMEAYENLNKEENKLNEEKILEEKENNLNEEENKLNEKENKLNEKENLEENKNKLNEEENNLEEKENNLEEKEENNLEENLNKEENKLREKENNLEENKEEKEENNLEENGRNFYADELAREHGQEQAVREIAVPINDGAVG